MNIDEFDEHIPKLLVILKELIVHPICENQPINEDTLSMLDEKVKFALDVFDSEGIDDRIKNGEYKYDISLNLV